MSEMGSPTTIEETRAPWVVRLLNKCGAMLERAGLGSKRSSCSQLIEKAKRRSGLEDFGEPDFFEPLSQLLESCYREAQLNVIGKLALKNDVVRILCNRLFLARDRRQYPEIAKQEIREPVFIVGLPRSGTTLLHTLLAADPAHRVPLTWEIMSPSPPDTKDRQQRIRDANRDLAMLRWLAPTFESVHATGAELPQECVSLMSPTFLSDQFDTMYNIPSYRAWFFRQDLRPAYEFHCRFLQHLQFRRSAERWILKAPAHMFAAPALLSIYPDAKFVQLHRDPIDAVASVSSLVTILRSVFSDAVDPIQIGQDAMVYWSEALKTFMRVRDQLSANRICDLQYDVVRRDPIAATKRVYEHFGWRLKRETEEKMGATLAEQASRTNGVHRYNAAYFQLDELNGFTEYCERFGLVSAKAIPRKERAEAAA
jgi:Sulfotransferase family